MSGQQIKPLNMGAVSPSVTDSNSGSTTNHDPHSSPLYDKDKQKNLPPFFISTNYHECNTLIESTFPAHILVSASPATKQLLSVANLTLTNLLHPFSTISNIYTRSLTHTYELAKWTVRFVSLDELRSTNAFDSYLKAILKQYDNVFSNQQFMKKSKYCHTKTFQVLRDEFLKLNVDAVDFSTIRHPVGILYAITPDESLDDCLKMDRRVSTVMGQLNADTDIHKQYVIFQDSTNPSHMKNGGALLDELMRRFGGMCCKLVPINSRQNHEPCVDDIWTPNMPKIDQFIRNMDTIETPKGKVINSFGVSPKSIERPEPLGERFSKRDVQSLETLVDGMIRNGILPTLQIKMENIHNNVAAKYGGRLKNIAKYFGFGSAKKKVDNVFSTESSEMQVIRLADYMFLLRDYQFAMQNYSKIRDDVKSNKRHYASINEFLALSSLLHLGPSKEVDSYISIAYDTYMECCMYKFAMRAALFKGLIHESNRQFDLASKCYTNAAHILDSDIYRSVLYEQGALSNHSIGSLRKATFYFTCASFNYCNQNLYSSAYRCHKAALSIMEHNTSWRSTEEFSKILMARLETKRNNFGTAIQYYNECLSRPKALLFELDHVAFFEEYRSIAEKCRTDDAVQFYPDLKIPQFISNQARILLCTFGDGEHMDKNDEKWESMEEDAARAVKKTVPFYRDDTKRMHISQIGTPFNFEFYALNPFNIPLNLTSVTPIYTFTPEDEKESQEQDVDSVPISIILLPKSQQTLHLSLTGNRRGILSIKGVRWILDDFVSGEALIELKGRRLNDSKEQRCSVRYSNNQSLSVKIIDPFPKVEVVHENFPKTVFNGEIVRRVITIKNTGFVPVKDICIKCSLPQLVQFAPIHENTPSMKEMTNTIQDISKLADQKWKSKTESLYFPNLGESGELSPSQSVDVVIFLRGLSLGTYDLRFLILYGPTHRNPDVPYRICRIHTPLLVEQSLFFHTYSQASVGDISKYLMAVTASNTSSSILNLKQVSCIGKDWTISPLTEFSNCSLKPNESVVLHFNIHRFNQGDSLLQTTIPLSNDKLAIDCSSTVSWELFKRNIMHTSKIRTIGANYERNAISLLVLWKESNSDRLGQLEIPQWQFLPQELDPVSGSPLRVCVHFDQTPIFNGKTTSPFVLPVQIQIQREISDRSGTITCVIEMLNNRDTGNYLWTGVNKKSIQVRPGEIVTHVAHAHIFQPGVYNMNRFRILWKENSFMNFNNQQLLCHVQAE